MDARPSGLSREVLVDAILDFVADQDLLARQDIRTALEREIDRAGPDALLALKARLVADNGWDYYPRHPLAQRIHHLLADGFLGEGSALHEAQQLALVSNAPVVIVANHLSYADANVIEVLLQRSGGAELANRLTAWVLPAGLAGPEALFPVEVSTLRPARVVVQLRRPILASALVARAARDRRIIMIAIGLAVAEALPPSYRGVYRNVDDFPEAKSVLRVCETRHECCAAAGPAHGAASHTSLAKACTGACNGRASALRPGAAEVPRQRSHAAAWQVG